MHDSFEWIGDVARRKFLSERFGQGCDLLKIGDALPVDSLPDLFGTEAGLTERIDNIALQLRAREVQNDRFLILIGICRSGHALNANAVR